MANNVEYITGIPNPSNLTDVESIKKYLEGLYDALSRWHFSVPNIYKTTDADFANTVNTGDSDTDDLIDKLVTALTNLDIIASS